MNTGAENELFLFEIIATGSVKVFKLSTIFTLLTYISLGCSQAK